MSKYGLTTEELILVKLIFLAQENHPEYYSIFRSECKHTDIYDLLKSLQEKDVILKSCQITKDKISAKDIVFNKVFLNNYLKYSYDMGLEMFEVYPKLLYIEGKPYSLRNIAKNYSTFDDFAFAYGKAIKFNEEKHQEVLELIEWAKEHDMIHYNICEFIISFKWEELKQLKNGDIGDNTYDPTELI